jgi:D-3-phosphoglycerate dehydrogenase
MKILFIDTAHPFLIDSLRRDGHECVEGYDFPTDKIESTISEYQGIVIRSRIKLDARFLEKAKNLIFIARAGAGMESIDVDYAQRKNIHCLNSPEGNRDAVGEHALGMLLALMNNLNRADRQIRAGEWKREENRGHEIDGKTVGIIGYGNMGSSFAAKLRGLGCNILAVDKYKKGFGSEWVTESDLEELQKSADIVSLHVPLSTETTYLVDDEFIQKFQKNIYIINTARGKCLHTEDLVKNLKSGKVLGACLDVNEYEDSSFEKFSPGGLSGNPTWQFLVQSDKVMLSPHIGGWTFESYEKISVVLYEKICGLKK